MRRTSVLLAFICLSASALAAAPFQGEVYRINKYNGQIVCRSSDLAAIQQDQRLYICDENNKLVAEVTVKRFFTTLLEVRLVSGSIDQLKVRMPVYAGRQQFENVRSQTVVRYGEDFDAYWWNAEVRYSAGGKEYNKRTTVLVPKLMELKGRGYDLPVLVDSEELAALDLRYLRISGIVLKDGKSTALEQIDFGIPSIRIPVVKQVVEEKFGKNVFNLNYEHAYRLELLDKVGGADAETIAAEAAKVREEEGKLRRPSERSSSDLATRNAKIRFEMKMDEIGSSLGRLKRASAELSGFAKDMSESQLKNAYEAYSLTSRYSGCLLNVLGFGIGSFVQGDTGGGLLLLSGDVLACGLAYFSMPFMFESSQTGTVMLISAGILAGCVRVFGPIRALSYYSGWQNEMETILNRKASSLSGPVSGFAVAGPSAGPSFQVPFAVVRF